MTTSPVSNLEYDLMITISNLLQARDPLVTYIEDADEAGDSETAALFKRLRDHNEEVALKLRARLAKELT
jgi:hypothetical protein